MQGRYLAFSTAGCQWWEGPGGTWHPDSDNFLLAVTVMILFVSFLVVMLPFSVLWSF